MKLIERYEDYYGLSIESSRIAKKHIANINSLAQKYVLSGNSNFFYDFETALSYAFAFAKR